MWYESLCEYLCCLTILALSPNPSTNIYVVGQCGIFEVTKMELYILKQVDRTVFWEIDLGKRIYIWNIRPKGICIKYFFEKLNYIYLYRKMYFEVYKNKLLN